MAIAFTVNGRRVSVEAQPDTPLLWVLRDDLRLTGTKYACGIAQCGACTVHLNGAPVRACVTPVASVQDAEVTTIEGVGGAEAAAVLAAWRPIDVPQCGYCQSGQIMSAVALLRETPRPGEEDIDVAMAGNICRCATYVRVRQAIHDAARQLEGTS